MCCVADSSYGDVEEGIKMLASANANAIAHRKGQPFCFNMGMLLLGLSMFGYCLGFHATVSVRPTKSPAPASFISASPEVIDNVGKVASWKAHVTISWENADPSTDVVGLYWATDATYPYAFFPVEESNGQRDVETLNFRQPVVYKLLRPSSQDLETLCQKLGIENCQSDPNVSEVMKVHVGEVLATSNTVSFKDFNAPHHLRIAQGSSPSEMRVMWTAKTPVGTPQVRVGTNTNYMTVFNGTTTNYTIDDMCGEPATDPDNFLSPGIIHEVLASGLQSNTKYYYQVSNGDGSWSAVNTFFTAPEVGTSDMVQSIVYGDLGAYMPLTTSVKGQASNFSNYIPAGLSTEFLNMSVSDLEGPLNIVHIGDVSYARGYGIFWEYFMNQIAPFASKIPYMIGIGNHEYDWPTQPFRPPWSKYGTDSGGECGIPYFRRFHMPGPGNSSYRNLYYSFDWGPIHYVIMSTETDFLEGSPQYEWIEADLASVDRDHQPWIVFMGHRPMYTSSDTWSNEYYLQQTYEPLFQKYHVDLGLWGHVHQYERTVSISYNGTEVPPGQGTVHVIIGNAGNTYQLPWRGSSEHTYPMPSWIVFRTHDYGVGAIRANKEKLEFATHDDNRFLVHDKFTLYSKDQKFRVNE